MKVWSSLLNDNGNLSLRLTLSQYGKAFGLSVAPVVYYSLVLIPHFIAIDWRALSILKN